MIKNKKGFTLLELIVVIAIVALFSAIATSISSYKNKNDDSMVKAEMKTIISQAQIYYLDNGNYIDIFDSVLGDSIVLAALNQIKTLSNNFTTNGGYQSDSQSWVAWAKLKGSGDAWCADSTNFSGLGAKSASGNYCE